MKYSRPALSAGLRNDFFAAVAADYPAPKQGDWIARDFKFHTGETMPELRLHYTTVGEPTGQPVLVLHGSGGSAASMLTPAFAGELFGPGQPLDAAKYYIIIPDGIGHGKSSKPSDGMKTAFPKYDYDDMVDAQYRLVKEGLGVKHLRLVIGNSMGGMHTWIWGVKYPALSWMRWCRWPRSRPKWRRATGCCGGSCSRPSATIPTTTAAITPRSRA